MKYMILTNNVPNVKMDIIIIKQITKMNVHRFQYQIVFKVMIIKFVKNVHMVIIQLKKLLKMKMNNVSWSYQLLFVVNIQNIYFINAPNVFLDIFYQNNLNAWNRKHLSKIVRNTKMNTHVNCVIKKPY